MDALIIKIPKINLAGFALEDMIRISAHVNDKNKGVNKAKSISILNDV